MPGALKGRPPGAGITLVPSGTLLVGWVRVSHAAIAIQAMDASDPRGREVADTRGEPTSRCSLQPWTPADRFMLTACSRHAHGMLMVRPLDRLYWRVCCCGSWA